jgi:uncharacterized protein
MIFLDTSAIYALADAKDPHHAQATAHLAHALERDEDILTHNYILIESMALIQKRIGLEAAMHLAADVKAFKVEWVDEATHDEAVGHLETMGRRGISLVDAVSFVIMRKRGIRTALAFDEDFTTEGFRLYGAG